MDLLTVIRDRAAGQYGDQRSSIVRYAGNSIVGAILFIFAYWTAPVHATALDKDGSAQSLALAAFRFIFVMLQFVSFVFWLRALIALRTKATTLGAVSMLRRAIRFVRQALALSNCQLPLPVGTLYASYVAVIFFGLGIFKSYPLFVLSDVVLLACYVGVSLSMYNLLKANSENSNITASV